jgi:TrmH family RNA methyltransferase
LLDHPNNVVLVCEQKPPAQCEILPGKKYLALDGIRDPGNMGTILRIADWFGIDGVMMSYDCVEIYNPKVVQSSMGSLIRVNTNVTDLESLFKSTLPVPVFGAMLKGESIYDLHSGDGWVLVTGNESTGIRENLLPLVKPVTIPSSGDNGAESLNAAVATAIICSEFSRQGMK